MFHENDIVVYKEFRETAGGKNQRRRVIRQSKLFEISRGFFESAREEHLLGMAERCRKGSPDKITSVKRGYKERERGRERKGRRKQENEKASIKYSARRQRERVKTTKEERMPVMARYSGSKGK